MADSLLDFDYNTMIDKALGTTNQPFKGLINDPNYDSSLNVNTLLGLGKGYFDSLYKDKTTGQKVISSLIGAKAGRTKGINDAVTNLFNQQKFNKNLADLTKAQQDILINQNKIGSFGEEALLRQNKIIDLQNKNYLTSLRNVGIKDRFKQLQEKADGGDLDALKQLQQFAVEPQKYMELEQSKDINNLDYSQGELSAARLFNLDVRNRKNWTTEQESNFNTIVNAPSVQEAAKINRENMAAHRSDPINIPFVKVFNVNEEIARIRKENKGAVNVNAAEKVMEKAMPIGKFEPNNQYPEGGFKANDGKLYSTDEWNKLGIERQNIMSLDTNRTETNENIKKVFADARTDAQSAQYGARNIDRTNKAVERILDNPEKFAKLFSTFGGRLPIAINKATGKFFATESDAQDIAALLNTIKGQQFTNEIQIMRANNKTGGAVGNVSDREVAMFQNMAANLTYDGTPEELWYQLNLLRSQGKKTVDIYTNNFAKYYGDDQANRYKIQDLSGDYTKQYNDNWQETINAARGNAVSEKINPSVKFLNPKSQEIMKQLLQPQGGN